MSGEISVTFTQTFRDLWISFPGLFWHSEFLTFGTTEFGDFYWFRIFIERRIWPSNFFLKENITMSWKISTTYADVQRFVNFVSWAFLASGVSHIWHDGILIFFLFWNLHRKRNLTFYFFPQRKYNDVMKNISNLRRRSGICEFHFMGFSCIRSFSYLARQNFEIFTVTESS